MIKLNNILNILIKNNFSEHISSDGWNQINVGRNAPVTIALFNKDLNDDIIHVLDFQRDKYWKNDNGKFCMNLGIFHKKYDGKYGFQNTDIIDTPYCFIQARLGIVKSGIDDWYEINTKTDLDGLALQLCNDYDLYGKTWFKRLSSDQNLIDWFKTDNKNLEMYMYLLIDDKFNARKCFRELSYRRIERESKLIQTALEEGLLRNDFLDEFKRAMIQSNEDLKDMLDILFKKEDKTAAREL